MSELAGDVRAEIAAATQAIFRAGDAGQAADRPAYDSVTWQRLEDGGFTLLGIDESHGGSGGGLLDAVAVLEQAGRHAVAIPIAETMLLAGWLLGEVGLDIPAGPLSFGPTTSGLASLTLEPGPSGEVIARGQLELVPWAGSATHIVAVAQRGQTFQVIRIPMSAAGGDGADDPDRAVRIEPGLNVAGEPRDRVILNGLVIEVDAMAELPAGWDHSQLQRRGALARAVMMAGAAQTVLDQTRSYTAVREQFGRPLARFQAVQQSLAALAAEVTAVQLSADAAAVALANDDPTARVAVASAKAYASAAAGTIASIGHQLHGAIGFTQESQLGLFTTRLWAWREEFGNELAWRGTVADLGFQRDADFWGLLTGSAVNG
jgi:acyl-CoA dehydrogenase